jgi:hypothetical protein
MRKLYTTVACATLLVTVMSVGSAQAKQNTDSNSAKSLGKTTLDTKVVDDGYDEMLYGTNIPNGEWITATKQGVEIGMRATDRTDGLLDVTGTNGNRVGVYEASTGFDGTTTNRAEWNYEFSVDLSGATGKAAGTTLADYTLVLEQNFTSQSLYGFLGTNPVSIPMPYFCDPDATTDTLCQQSWNPVFGNDDFDPVVAGTYDFRLVLEPATFNGPPIAVAIQVNVTAP